MSADTTAAPTGADNAPAAAGDANRPATNPATGGTRAGVEDPDTTDRRDRLAVIEATLADLAAHLDVDRTTNVGFPSTFDIDYTPLWPFFNRVLNNVGDPYQPSAFPANTKHIERDLIDAFADLFRLPADDRWGYATTGGHEGNEWGLLTARTLHPDGVVYHGASAHYSVAKLAAKLRMPAIAIRTDDSGQLDYTDLRNVLHQHRDRPAIIVATIGTTMTEAVDDISIIRHVLADVPIRRSYIHVDAALSGLPLALRQPEQRLAFDFADGADSLSVSGHKFLGSPFPCGLVLARRSLRNRLSNPVDYIATDDVTIGGSRNGHAVLIQWYAHTLHGVTGLRQRADAARELSAYTVNQLDQHRWPAWRFEHAFTVVLNTPPPDVARTWRLATSGTHSHIICLPGMTVAQIDRLIKDIVSNRVTDPQAAPAPAFTPNGSSGPLITAPHADNDGVLVPWPRWGEQPR